MNRRTLITRTVGSTASALVFTATGWLMGTGRLGMAPPPPADGGCIQRAAGPSKITCVGVTGCSSIMCAYTCNEWGDGRIWWGCNNENPPCSTGFCAFETFDNCAPC